MRQLKITKRITNRSDISLDKYLQDITKIRMITVAEEVDLAYRIKAGDKKALEELVNANLRFVVSVAKQYQNRGITLSDLIGEGNTGLIKAAHRFDVTRGFKFISYAVWWIRQSMEMAISEHAKNVRLPLNVLGMSEKIRRAGTTLEQQLEREPTNEEIAECLKTTPRELRKYIDYVGKQEVSLDAPLTTSSDTDGTLLDVLHGISVTDAGCEIEDLSTEIKRSLGVLAPREQEVIVLFFGLDNQRSLTLEEIGEKMGLHKERIRQLKEKAIRRLKRSFAHKNLKAYLG